MAKRYVKKIRRVPARRIRITNKQLREHLKKRTQIKIRKAQCSKAV